MKDGTLGQLFSIRSFNEIDTGFAEFLVKSCGDESCEVAAAALLTSYFTGKGDVCISIPVLSGKPLSAVVESADDIPAALNLPPEKTWMRALRSSPVIGAPGQYRPLVLDDRGRLYLYRYWKYECDLADSIISKINEGPHGDHTGLKKLMDRYFPQGREGDVDWQRVSAFNAMTKPFSILSGGPGTGKTTTIAKVIIMLIEQALSSQREIKIALAAPTGKAASRLRETVAEAVKALHVHESVIPHIPPDAFTLHRLLSPRYGTPYFKYGPENPLPQEVFIIDEASMVDLPLMSKFFRAVPAGSKIILLGDRDQLSSIEAGSVYGDICGAGVKPVYSSSFSRSLREGIGERLPEDLQNDGGPRIGDSIVILNRSYRFRSAGGIGELSRAIRSGDTGMAMEALRPGVSGDISLREFKTLKDMHGALKEVVPDKYAGYFSAHGPGEGLELLSRFRILCPLRKGPYGVEYINEFAERSLASAGLISGHGAWYPGRPVIVNKNRYDLRLYNGDMGIFYRDESGEGELRVFFMDYEKGMRKIIPIKLPEHESLYAMTVHKSQGTEFDEVLLILPDRTSPVLTRELLYTAVTRAKKGISIWGSPEIIKSMIENPVERRSGLRERLWMDDPA